MTLTTPARSDRTHLWLGLVIFVLALLASWWFIDFVASTGDRLERDRVQSLARTAAATLESGRIASLRGSSADIATPTRSISEVARSAKALCTAFCTFTAAWY